MKKMWLLASMLFSMLLVAAFAAAEISGDFRFTRYQPYEEPKQQRLIMDEYRNWFVFDGIDNPAAQRILDVESLDVDTGDLATPAVLGAQRVLTPRDAWMFGYDLETGEPLLSPYGQRRILKAKGYGASPVDVQPGEPVQMSLRQDFRTRRAKQWNMYLARKTNRMNIIKRYSSYPLNAIESLDNLDTRPIYLDEYERNQWLRDTHSNILLRQRFLGALPGFSYTELYERAGSGQYPSQVLNRQQWLGAAPGMSYSDLSKHFGEDLEQNSNILLRNAFIRSQPDYGNLVFYDRYDRNGVIYDSNGDVVQQVPLTTIETTQ